MRFGEKVSDPDLQQCSNETESLPCRNSGRATPQSMIRRNNWAVRTWKTWAINRNDSCKFVNEEANVKNKYVKVDCNVEEMDAETLAYWLGKFVMEVRKQDGSGYPFNSLLSLVLGLHSYLKADCGVNFNILRDTQFEQFHQILEAERKRLSIDGDPTAQRKTKIISPADEERLWVTQQLGDHNPHVLVRTIMFLNGKHFGLRGAHEHQSMRMKKPQITIHKCENSEKSYLVYKEDEGNAQGRLGVPGKPRSEVKHYAARNPERCHVQLLEKYLSLCPKDLEVDALYLTPLRKPTDTVWYSKHPVGANQLGKFTKLVSIVHSLSDCTNRVGICAIKRHVHNRSRHVIYNICDTCIFWGSM